MSELETLQSWIDQSHNIVFFGGAGVSTESGIKDFRSPDGLYNQHYKFPPETMLSRSFFDAHPEEFFRFYRDKMLNPGAKPNAAHKKLAELEAAGKLRSVITQNIDGLHQEAGSRRVWELHGSVLRNRCMRCGKPYPTRFLAECEGVPRCACGGIVKPEVVLYEESLDAHVLEGAVADLRCGRPTCSSSGGPPWWSTPPPGSSTTTGGTGWSSSTRPPPPMTGGPIWCSPDPSGRFWDRFR